MRVTMLTHNYLPYCRAGSEKMMHELGKALVDAGHSVMVLCEHEKRHTELVDSIPVLFSPRPAKEAAFYDCDIIISHHRLLAEIKQSKAKQVAVFHNDNAMSVKDAQYPWALSICNTNWLHEALKPHNPIVLHPPVFPEEYPSQTGGEYITLVNLLPEKGSDIFYRLAEAFPNEKFLGVIGGYGKQDIRHLPNVTIQPSTENMVRDVYSKTKIILMPSAYESYGMVAVEAAYCGIPVICSNTKGLLEANGAAFHSENSAEDFARILNQLIRKQSLPNAVSPPKLANSRDEIMSAVCKLESLMH